MNQQASSDGGEVILHPQTGQPIGLRVRLPDENDHERIDHWNYRVLHRSFPIADTGDYDESFEIMECYYGTDGEIVAWGEAGLVGNSPNDLQATLLKMAEVAGLASLRSKKRRPLTLDDLPGVDHERA